MYIVQKVLTKLNNNECSGFLDPQELNDVKRKLDKIVILSIIHIKIVKKISFTIKDYLKFYFMK